MSTPATPTPTSAFAAYQEMGKIKAATPNKANKEKKVKKEKKEKKEKKRWRLKPKGRTPTPTPTRWGQKKPLSTSSG